MKVFSSIKKMISIESPKKKAGRISICILITALIFIAFPAWSADYYIAQSAAGSRNGSSCANAKAYTWDWTSPNVTDGDTVYVCGTITGSADHDSASLVIPKSGTSAPITVKFCKDGEANCGTGNTGKFSSKYWSLYGAIYSASKNYITIDGNGGIIENTDNGDLKTYHVRYSPGVYLDGGNNLEVKNLTIRNLYIKKYMDAGDYTVSSFGIAVYNGSNVSIHNNTVNNAASGINYVWNSVGNYSTVAIYNNTITDCNWGIAFPGGAGSSATTLTDISIYNNDIAIGAQWTSPSDKYHHNGMIAWSDQSNPGTITNAHIYNNYVHGPTTLPGGYTNPTDVLGTGFVFIQYTYATGIKIYNNLFAGETSDVGNGYIYLEYIRATGTEIYNNTIIGFGNAGRCIGFISNIDATVTIKNNICSGTGLGIDARQGVGNHTVTVVADNNLYYGITRLGVSNDPTYHDTLAAWQTYLGGCPGTGRECNSIITNPDLNANYTPKVTSPVVGKGVNLTSRRITALNSDKGGVARPSNEAWDMGAYAYGYNKPKPPLNLRIN
jgi:hypothetical protein